MTCKKTLNKFKIVKIPQKHTKIWLKTTTMVSKLELKFKTTQIKHKMTKKKKYNMIKSRHKIIQKK